MAVNLNFSKGSNADKDFMTCHLLTGIVARKVINNVLDRSVDALDSEYRKVLHDLWISNLKAVGGLPAQQEQLLFDIESIRKLKRLSESLPPVVAKGRMTMPEPFMQRPTLIFKQSQSGTGIRESYVLKSEAADIVPTTSEGQGADKNKSNPTAAESSHTASTKIIHVCEKCTAEELAFLQIVARYGTKVQVRISEAIPESSGSNSGSSSSSSSSSSCSSTSSEVDSEPLLNRTIKHRFRWRSGRIAQITPEAVTVRFIGGIDLRVLWITRDIRLYKHTSCAKKSSKQGICPLISQNTALTLTDPTSNYVDTNPDQIVADESERRMYADTQIIGDSEPMVDTIATLSSSSSSTFSAAAAFLTQQFESDSDDGDRYGIAERGRYGSNWEGMQGEGEGPGFSSDMMELDEFTDLEQYNNGDVDADVMEWSTDGCDGAGGDTARCVSRDHAGVLGLENLIRQYREGEGVGGSSEHGNGNSIEARHHLNNLDNFHAVNGEEHDHFGELHSVCSTGDMNHQSKKRRKEFIDIDNTDTIDTGSTDSRDPGKENEIEEAACRLKDENDYFIRLKHSQSESKNRFCMGGSDLDYQEQYDLLQRWKDAHIRPGTPSSTLQEDSCDASYDLGGEVDQAKSSLNPSEDPDVPTPLPDVIIFGRLGKMLKGSNKTTDWEFFLREVYMHFTGQDGKDLALPRCLLKFGTGQFIAVPEAICAANMRAKELNARRGHNIQKSKGRPFKRSYQPSD